tara:strand:+ start:2735 stop:3157 length:423 start_codon:yes stop_codon:yes gene_type:complete
MLNNLLLAAILTVVLYLYNQNTGNILDNTQYALAFVAFALGIAIAYRFVLPKGSAPPSVLEMVGIEQPTEGPNGGNEVPCFNVPYHIVSSQYGDKAMLAGYNEAVQPHQTGAAGYYEPPEGVGSTSCKAVGHKEEKIAEN